MRKNKKAIMALSFCIGAMMFVTTAFADIASKTGYDQFKDAIKYTAGQCADNLQSVTIEGTVVLKDNDKVLVTSNFTEKYDRIKKVSESSSGTELANGKKERSYRYADQKGDISCYGGSDVYYINEYDGSTSGKFQNPFEDEQAKDFEKIFDAVIGNLRDYVVVEDKPDGSKEFSGSLGEAQIPALVNAVSSIGFKQMFDDHGNVDSDVPVPALVEDVFIKSVKGKAVTSKDKMIESIFATGILSGKDKAGKTHDLTVDILGKVKDVNSTVIVKPNLEGKKVEKHTNYYNNNQDLPKKLVGKYKNDIVIDKNDSYIKVGERWIEITSINGKNVEGRYYEQYNTEYANDYGKNKKEFTFKSEVKDYFNGDFEYIDAEGKVQKGNLSFRPENGNLYFSPHTIGEMNYDGDFDRVFDK